MVAIDLHRGHLDGGRTSRLNPLPPRASARPMSDFSPRPAAGIPIFHCVATYRDSEEIRLNRPEAPRRRPQQPRKNVLQHNIADARCEFIPSLLDPSDFIVDAKKALRLLYCDRSRVTLRAHASTPCCSWREHQFLRHRDGTARRLLPAISRSLRCRTASIPWTARLCMMPRLPSSSRLRHDDE